MVTRSLLTDLYELTMAASYLEHGKASDSATFDLYIRHNPFHGGYAIAAGLEDAVRASGGMPAVLCPSWGQTGRVSSSGE